jgi:hypothetical protein
MGEGNMVDRYTKAVLTVIAVALVGLVAQNSLFPAQAQYGQLVKVVICDQSGLNCAGVSRIGSVEGKALLTQQN